jgi:hypothetical protein
MKRPLFITAAMIAVACHAVPRTQQSEGTISDNSRQQITQLERQWADAVVRRDTAAVARILADEFTDIDENRVASRSQYLAEVSSFRPTSESIVLADNSVRIHGNTAVSTGRYHWQGEPPSGGARYIAVYVRRDGRWQAVAFQATPSARQ